MKTDSLFYRLLQRSPSILFELMGQPGSEAIGYEFRSVEIKQTAFRWHCPLLNLPRCCFKPRGKTCSIAFGNPIAIVRNEVKPIEELKNIKANKAINTFITVL